MPKPEHYTPLLLNELSVDVIEPGCGTKYFPDREVVELNSADVANIISKRMLTVASADKGGRFRRTGLCVIFYYIAVR